MKCPSCGNNEWAYRVTDDEAPISGDIVCTRCGLVAGRFLRLIRDGEEELHEQWLYTPDGSRVPWATWRLFPWRWQP